MIATRALVQQIAVAGGRVWLNGKHVRITATGPLPNVIVEGLRRDKAAVVEVSAAAAGLRRVRRQDPRLRRRLVGRPAGARRLRRARLAPGVAGRGAAGRRVGDGTVMQPAARGRRWCAWRNEMPFDHEQPAVAELPLEAIRIGDRFRRELGDIASLASSIAEIGLLHPIVLTSENELIAGARRIAAFRQLGRTIIPAHVVPLADIARGEFDENAVRSDFLPSEYVAIKRALADEERRQARQRQLATLKRGDDQPVRASSPNGANGRSGDKIARAAGVSRRTMEKADAVVAAAEREPERFAGLVEEMDRTRRVDGVYRKLVVSEKAAVIRQEAAAAAGAWPIPGDRRRSALGV